MHTKHVKTERKKDDGGEWEGSEKGNAFPLKDDPGARNMVRNVPGKIRKTKRQLKTRTRSHTNSCFITRETNFFSLSLPLSSPFFLLLLILLFLLLAGGLETSQGCGTGYRGTWSFWSCRQFFWPGRSIKVNNFLGAFNLPLPPTLLYFPALDIRSFILLGIRFAPDAIPPFLV